MTIENTAHLLIGAGHLILAALGLGAFERWPVFLEFLKKIVSL